MGISLIGGKCVGESLMGSLTREAPAALQTDRQTENLMHIINSKVKQDDMILFGCSTKQNKYLKCMKTKMFTSQTEGY